MERVLSLLLPSRLPRHLHRALFILALGPLCLDAWGASAPLPIEPRSPRLERAALAASKGALSTAREELSGLSQEEANLPTVRFVRASIALEDGDLAGAASDLRALREALPERPEPRLLESLLALRRERPSLDWREAFLQAWNAIGRPDFRDSPLLDGSEEPPSEGISPAEAWKRELPAETRAVLALYMTPEADRARVLLQQLPLLAPPELLLSAFEYFENENVPEPLRSQARSALLARLAALSSQFPDSMQLRALALVGGTDPKAPFTPQELQELEALSRLPDWRQTEFLSLYQYALGHFETTGLTPAVNYAYTLAVCTLAGPAPLLLLKRTQASHDALTPAERQRLGEALWRIGSRIAAESTILERFVGLNLMKKGATEMGDTDRLQEATTLSADAHASYEAMQRAQPNRWPLHSLQQSMIDAAIKDEVAHMRAFSPPADAR